MDFIIQIIIFSYGVSWVYKKYIKNNDNNEISKGINNFINSIKEEFNTQNNSNTKNSTQRIYDDEKKRKGKESYGDALRLYKAGVITKQELREFKK